MNASKLKAAFGLFFTAFFFLMFALISCAPESSNLNLVFVSIDTLSADHLGCYGYNRKTSPTIDGFANKSILFRNAYSHSPKTAPSHMSMFTSLYHTVHGVFMFDQSLGPVPYRLDEKIPTLAEIMAEADYTCVAYTGGGNISREYGFDKGFEIYDCTKDHWQKGLDWIRAHHREKFFVFFHTYAVHDPYLPPEPYASRFNPGYSGNIKGVEEKGWAQRQRAFWSNVDENNPDDIKQLIALYDGAIMYMDDHLMKPFLDLLDELQLFDNTIVVFTSDHGEEFKEHGRFKHEQVYDELLHVPLVIFLPPVLAKGKEERLPHAQVRLIDLMPTILELLEIKYNLNNLQGISLIPVMEGREKTDRLLYACRVPSYTGKVPYIRNNVIRYNGLKLIYNVRKRRNPMELFDITKDPGEKMSLHATHTRESFDLMELLREVLLQNQILKESRGYRTRQGFFENSTLEKLKALGYID